jgi:hypothetical protein
MSNSKTPQFIIQMPCPFFDNSFEYLYSPNSAIDRRNDSDVKKFSDIKSATKYFHNSTFYKLNKSQEFKIIKV